MNQICPVCGKVVASSIDHRPRIGSQFVHVDCATLALTRLLEFVKKAANPADGTTPEQFAMQVALGTEGKKT